MRDGTEDPPAMAHVRLIEIAVLDQVLVVLDETDGADGGSISVRRTRSRESESIDSLVSIHDVISMMNIVI